MIWTMFPQEYAIGFSESIPQPWVKPSDNRATFVDPPLIKKPFLDPPSSGSLLDTDKTMKPGFDSSDCRVLGEFVEKPSYQVGPALLRSQLKRQEFPWTSFKYEAATHVNKVWQKWVFTVLFEEDGNFVRRLKFAGVAEAIHTSAGLGVQRNGYDMSLLWQRRVKKSSSKDEHPKTCGSSKGKEVVGDKQDSRKKITVKYSYSNWSRYFFGDFLNGKFVPAPAVPSDPREADFVAYWLSNMCFWDRRMSV
ncbi:hypothetical protein AHAS_Ahas15G0139600 [Arachis hypogaea]